MDELLIRRGDKIFTPSIYQKEILKFAKEGIGSCYINACAGASKTTMLENILYQIKASDKKLFIAFNKSIVDEMRNRVDGVDNLKITTYHSLGYSILRENFPDKDFIIDEDKYNNFLRHNINSLSKFGETKSLGNSIHTYITNIIHLIDYSRYYLTANVRGIKKMADQYGLNIVRDEVNVCKKILEWGRDNIDVIDYTDMVWLVNEYNLQTKKYLYNIILVDEAQDTSIMQQELISRCKKRGSRIFIVGDEHQSINIWCGADMNAINRMCDDNFEKYKLPISYRCPKKIVELAKQYSPNIENENNAIDGEINYNVSLSSPLHGDMVLCRNTAPLIEYYLRLLSYNKKVYVKGGEDIAKKFNELIDYSDTNYIDNNCEIGTGLIPKLYEDLLNCINRLIENGYDIDGALHHGSVINKYDDINAIKVLSANLITCEELKNKIRTIFNDRSNDGIILSTIHKAKGLEADNIFILCPSLLPSKFVKKEWEIKAEEHLTYVAYTRSKKTLNFMSEDDRTFKTGASFAYNKLKNEILFMSEQLNIPLKEMPSGNTLSSNVSLKPKIIKKQENNSNKTFSNKFNNLFS